MKQIKTTKNLIITGVILFVFLTTCTYKASDPTVCFNDNILPIFVSKCSMSGCHAPGSHKLDLTTYDGIMKGVTPNHPLESKIYTKISGFNSSMPPKSHIQLTDQEIYMIKAWISMGALNSSNCTICDTTSFKFSTDVQPILNSWCTGCHTAGNASGGIDLSTYQGVVNSISGNKLLGSIMHSTGYYAMPQNGNQLPNCLISKIRNWINAGYPNN